MNWRYWVKLLINDIIKLLPHRYPFLLVDAVDELEIGKKIIARKNVTYNEDFFIGHFPEDPIMPGVLIIEALAQTAAILTLSLDKYKNKKIYLGEIEKAKFKCKVRPSDILIMEATIVKNRGNITEYHGIAYVNNELCADVLFKCSVS